MNVSGLTNLKTAKLFQNGQSQAVRLPKECRFEGEEVYVKRIGSGVMLWPKTDPWGVMLDALKDFTPDFMSNGRQQPAMQEREEMAFIPQAHN